jgi:hypothetical protein
MIKLTGIDDKKFSLTNCIEIDNDDIFVNIDNAVDEKKKEHKDLPLPQNILAKPKDVHKDHPLPQGLLEVTFFSFSLSFVL